MRREWARTEKTKKSETNMSIALLSVDRRQDVVITAELPRTVQRAFLRWRNGTLVLPTINCEHCGLHLSRWHVELCCDLYRSFRAAHLNLPTIPPPPPNTLTRYHERAQEAGRAYTSVDFVFVATRDRNWTMQSRDVIWLVQAIGAIELRCRGWALGANAVVVNG